MSYTKREWAPGNVVGAVDLNRIRLLRENLHTMNLL